MGYNFCLFKRTIEKINMTEKVIVSVSEGRIRGFKNKSTLSGAEFYSFLGVPYGQSTAGHARFQDPTEVKPWKNVLNATTEKGGCFQFSLYKKQLDGSEDCLYNCIHTPTLSRKCNEPLKAVIVNIHPGSYHMGSPDPSFLGSPNHIMHNDIVYVCVGFRIHILGFLNLNLKECSGNQAIKDIILSLKWIQRNISNFGGDPSNVTLLGSSSGAEIVNNLMISPQAKGLFHKAIIMGQYKYCPNAIFRNQNSKVAFDLARNVGYDGPYDSKKLLSFYKKLDMRTLIFARPERLFDEGYAPVFPISPFVTTIESGENPVLPTSDRQNIIKSTARIPLMIGFCQREAVMGFLPPFRKSTMGNYYKSIRHNYWGWGRNLSDSQLKIIQNRIESYYLDGKSIDDASLSTKCNIQMDIMLSDLHTSLIDVIAADLPSSVYVYKFEFEGNINKFKDYFNFTFEEPLEGTFHGDDYSYWAGWQADFAKKVHPLTPETKKMVKTFTELISTFAKTGDPNYDEMTTKWKPTTVENPCYLSINNNLSMVDGKLNGDRMLFWENLKEEMEKMNKPY